VFNKMNRTILLLLISLISVPVFANVIKPDGLDAWEVYVIGGASVFYDIFFSIILFVKDPSFTTLALTVAFLGFFVFTIQSIGGIDPKKVVAYFIGVMAASYLTFSATVNINIIDALGATANDQTLTVSDVPASIGLPAAWISEIGESFTRKVSTNFSHADNALSYVNTRTINMEGQILRDTMSAHPFTAELTRSLSLFYQDCVFPLIVNGTVSIDALMNGDDMLGAIAPHLSDAITTIDYTDGGTLIECKTVYDNSYSGQITTQLGNYLGLTYHGNEHISAADKATVSSANLGTLATAILSSVHDAGGTVPNASSVVKNRAVSRAFDAGISTSGSKLGISKEQLSGFLIEGQAMKQTTEGWRMAIETFNSMAGYIFTVLHAFILGIAPLIIIFTFIPGVAGKVVLSYVQVLFWLTLWQPMFSIVNYIVISFQNNAIASLVGKAADGTYGNMASPGTWAPIHDAIDKYTLAAGFLGTMVPMLSWGLVKGAMNFSQFISAGVGSSAASGAAQGLATGTLSMDNSSFNNTSGNKFDTTASIKSGMGMSTYSSIRGGGVNRSEFTGDQTSQTGNQTHTMSYEAATAAQSATQKTSELAMTKSLDQVNSTAFQSQVGAMSSLNDTLAEQVSSGDMTGANETKANMRTLSQQISRDHKGSNSDNVRVANSLEGKSNASAVLLKVLKDPEKNEALKAALNTGTADSVGNAFDNMMDKNHEDYNPEMKAAVAQAGMGGENATVEQDIAAYKKGFVKDMTQDMHSEGGEDGLTNSVGAYVAAEIANGAVSDIANVFKLGGIYGATIPSVKVSGTDAIRYDSAYTRAQSQGGGLNNMDAQSASDMLQETRSITEGLVDSSTLTNIDSVNDTKANGLTYQARSGLQTADKLSNSISASRSATSKYSLTQDMSQDEFHNDVLAPMMDITKSLPQNNYQNDLSLKGSSTTPATDEGQNLVMPDGTTVQDLQGIEGKAKANAPITTATDKVASNINEDGKVLEKKVTTGIDDTENHISNEKSQANVTEVISDQKRDQMSEENIMKDAISGKVLQGITESKAMEGTKTSLIDAARNGLNQISGTGEVFKAQQSQGNNAINALENAEGKKFNSRLADDQKTTVGSAGFQSQSINLSSDGKGLEGELEYSLASDNNPKASYSMDDDGNMKRVDEGFEKEAQIVQTENGDYREYGKNLDGEKIYRNIDGEGNFIEGNNRERTITGEANAKVAAQGSSNPSLRSEMDEVRDNNITQGVFQRAEKAQNAINSGGTPEKGWESPVEAAVDQLYEYSEQGVIKGTVASVISDNLNNEDYPSLAGGNSQAQQSAIIETATFENQGVQVEPSNIGGSGGGVPVSNSDSTAQNTPQATTKAEVSDEAKATSQKIDGGDNNMPIADQIHNIEQIALEADGHSDLREYRDEIQNDSMKSDQVEAINKVLGDKNE